MSAPSADVLDLLDGNSSRSRSRPKSAHRETSRPKSERRDKSRPKSEHRDSDQRARRRSPNRVQTRAANPALITSILDSLHTLAPPPHIAADERFSDTESRSSHPNSAFSIAPSQSPGFGVEYGTSLALDDDEGVSDAALPPTIRTSRPPSGLSSRRTSYTAVSPGTALRAPSLSRRSSRSSLNLGKGRSASNKLSAASWVSHNSVETFETRETNMSGESRKSRRSLRRITSQESLRPARTEIKFVPPASDDDGASPPPNISRAEQIVMKGRTPPTRNAKKQRLYITEDPASDEAPDFEALPLEPKFGAPVPQLRRASEQELRTESDEPRKPHRRSPQESAIVDSIPMRTSSLRHSSKSPNPSKKKERKSKRQNARSEKVDSKVSSIEAEEGVNTPIKEDNRWADLGDDDETVKRIRELREQRKSRLLDQRAFSMPDGVPTASITEANQVDEPAKLQKENVQPTLTSPAHEAPRTEEAYKRTSRTNRPAPNRASTVDTPSKSKAHKVLGITEDTSRQSNNVPTNKAASGKVSPEIVRQRKYSLDQNRPYMRPVTAQSSNSTTPALSLDYSYAQAVDALQGTESEIFRRKEPSIKPSPLKATYLDLNTADTPLRETSPTATRKSSTKRRPEHRWTHHHPDLPLDSERKKDRRKSTSDARVGKEGQQQEPEPPVPERDSVEVALLEYLHNPRLSRKLRHPQTGRVISFSEVGDPNGAAVFVCLGMGLTRYVTAFYDELAITLRLRLITIDRPGVGNSEPYPSNDRSGPMSWPDDLLAVCHHLGIHTFSLLAHSAGAIYALASALILPQMIQGKVHLLGPWIPPSQLEAVLHSAATPAPVAALPRSQRFLRVLPTPFLKVANSSFMTATSTSLKPNTKRSKTATKLETIPQDTVLSAGSNKRPKSARPSSTDGYGPRPSDFQRRESLMLMDQYMPDINPMGRFPINGAIDEESPPRIMMSATASPTDPNFEYAYSALHAAEHEEQQRKSEFTSRLTQCTWELATKDSNPATDLLVCLERNRDVGFRYTDVTRDVVITHGAEDKRVPVANVKWLADQMSRRVLPGVEEGGCEVRVLEGEGHGLMASPLIMGDVLTEIAGYWKRGALGG